MNLLLVKNIKVLFCSKLRMLGQKDIKDKNIYALIIILRNKDNTENMVTKEESPQLNE